MMRRRMSRSSRKWKRNKKGWRGEESEKQELKGGGGAGRPEGKVVNKNAEVEKEYDK